MNASDSCFNGFSPELCDFLLALKCNNTSEQQAENIVKYKALITEPLHRLYGELCGTVTALGLPVETRPARCVSTPYADRRFAPNAPLKEYLYLRFKREDRVTDIPGLYFDLGLEYYGCGIRIYKPTARGMYALHERIARDPDAYSAALSAVSRAGFSVCGDLYKRDHAPQMPSCPAKDLLNRKSILIERAAPVGGCVFSYALADELSGAFRTLSPLFSLL